MEKPVKKILFNLPLIALFLSLIITYSACKTDEIVQPEDDSLEKESVTANNVAILNKIITDASSSTILLSTGIVPHGTTSCPSTYDSAGSFLYVPYGEIPGCTSALDGVRRSGAYQIGYTLSPTRDTVTCSLLFNDFRTWKTTSNADTNAVKISGSVYYTTIKTGTGVYSIKARGEVVYTNQSGELKFINVDSLKGTVNTNVPGDLSDDSYSIYGHQRVQDNKYSITYQVNTPSTSPMVIKSNCKYPISGMLNLTAGGTTQCDFSAVSGTCDAIVKITKGSVSKDMDLSIVNF